MTRAVLLLAEGFEEIEAVTCIDVLRRAKVHVTTLALAGPAVRGSHDIVIQADASLDGFDSAGYDAIVLPGGMPGSKHLREDKRVLELVRRFASAGKLTAAICAAPTALEAAGVLNGRRATCYPGNQLPSARFEDSAVVEDGPIVTSRSAGTALEFALALVRRLCGAPSADQVRESLLLRVE